MSEKNQKFILSALGVLVMSLLAGYFILAWNEPFQNPPGRNVPAPINVGPQGQAKEGGLILNTGGAPIGLIVQNGNVGIGTTAPRGKLDISNKTIYVENVDQLIDAVTNTPEGAMIILLKGTYVLPSTLEINKSLTLKGESHNVIITGGNFPFLNITASYVDIEDIRFVGSDNPAFTNQVGIYVNDVNNVRIIRSMFEGLYTSIYYHGVNFYHTIENSYFYSAQSNMIYADDRLNIIISNVQVFSDHSKSFLVVEKTDTIRLVDSLISGSFTSPAVWFKSYFGGTVIIDSTDIEATSGDVPALRIEGSPSNLNRFYQISNSYLGGGSTTGNYTVSLSNVEGVHFDNVFITGRWRGIGLGNIIKGIRITNSRFETPDVPIAAFNDAIIDGLYVESNSYTGGYPFVYLANIGASNQKNILITNNFIPNSNVLGVQNNVFITTTNTTLSILSGNVGIGTVNPGYKLDVSGKIHATDDICTDLGGGKCLSTIGGGGGTPISTGLYGFCLLEYIYNPPLGWNCSVSLPPCSCSSTAGIPSVTCPAGYTKVQTTGTVNEGGAYRYFYTCYKK